MELFVETFENLDLSGERLKLFNVRFWAYNTK